MTFLLWGGFVAFVIAMLALDLFVVNRKAHTVSAREAVAWTGVCVALALAFNVLVYYMYQHQWFGLGTGEFPLTGKEAAQQFFAGWLVEYSLSLDNIFVIALVFQYFRVPQQYQHRVLFLGILGALVMRGAMIVAGAALIRRFEWMEYVFGAVLLYTAFRMFMAGDSEPEPEKGWVVRLSRRLFRMSSGFEGEKFFTRLDGRLAITPLFLVLMVVETTDVVFAVDSIPAIFGITKDPFLVFSSNVFAILGLRSLYFALAAIIDKFKYLKTALVAVLAFVGVKMLLSHIYPIPTTVSLLVIVGLLGVGLMASVVMIRDLRMRDAAPNDEFSYAADLAWRRGRRVVILVVGLTIIFIVAPLSAPIPGPGGIPIALAGLALLASEFVWARKLLRNLRQRAQVMADAAVGAKPKIWTVPALILVFIGAVATLIYWEPAWTAVILMGASGPAIAIGYWALQTTRRWKSLRALEAKRAAAPAPEAPPAPNENAPPA
jgi:tellurite resistance protein TerC